MVSDNQLEKVKKLRQITGVGFKDCMNAINESKGDIDKSIEFLRKKGISKATKRMQKVASDGLVSIHQNKDKISIIEINCETDFVAKNNEFVNFVEQVSEKALLNDGSLEKILNSAFENKKTVNETLIDLVSKIGEKITIRRSKCLSISNGANFSYIHTPTKKNIGKLGVILSLECSEVTSEINEFGHRLSMHIAASNPLSIDENDLDNKILEKEKEIIKENLKSMGKKPEMLDKIAQGKLRKFVEENTLMNQTWIMDQEKKVKDIVKNAVKSDKLQIKSFIRYKVGEGV